MGSILFAMVITSMLLVPTLKASAESSTQLSRQVTTGVLFDETVNVEMKAAILKDGGEIVNSNLGEMLKLHNLPL